MDRLLSGGGIAPPFEAHGPDSCTQGRWCVLFVQNRFRNLSANQPLFSRDGTAVCLEMTPRETKLAAALDANVALRVQAERLIAAYVEPESDRPVIINDLIRRFDGPQQREAQRLTQEALGDATGV
jgi:hypothetical protein